LHISSTNYDVIPATVEKELGNTTFKVYWNNKNVTLGESPSVSELTQFPELPSWALSVSMNSSSIELVCYSADISLVGTYEVIVARIFHSFSDFVKINTFKVELKVIPEFTDIKKPFFTTPLENQII